MTRWVCDQVHLVYEYCSASTTSTVPGMPGTQYGVANAVDTG